MARKIFGRISNQSGAGVGGLRVQAWDDDWPDDNDFMGEAITCLLYTSPIPRDRTRSRMPHSP